MMSNKIDSFKGKYYFLSNFYSAKVNYEDLVYDNNEAAFQAQKDPTRAKEFVGIPPNKAKSLGRRVNLRTDWEDVKIDIMADIVKAKFTQNENLRAALINTDNAKLIEGNNWGDVFWGVDNGEGKNELGNILMKLRDEFIRSKNN